MAGTDAAPLAGLRVLVAEDNTFNQLVVRGVLERAGASVTIVGDGAEALAAVETQAPFDLIVLDVQMPVMDGLEAARRIRALTAGTSVRIVAMTANDAPEDRAACMAAGMDDLIGKPITPETVVARLRR